MTDQPAPTVAVRHPEGLVHGFLTLKTLDGKALADGDLIQKSRRSGHQPAVFHF
jgi:hypothetical protein